MKKYILWDHDGVLVDTEHWYFHTTQRAMAELGVELPLELYLQRMVKGLNSWDLAREAGIDEAIVQAGQVQRDSYYQDHLRREDIEIPGVIDTLPIDEIKQHYYASHESINPSRVVATGPALDFLAESRRVAAPTA